MSLSTPKKTHKQQWDEAKRNVTAKDWARLDFYRATQFASHPYSPNNPSNPYAQPHSVKGAKPKQEQSSSDNPSEIESG